MGKNGIGIKSGIIQAAEMTLEKTSFDKRRKSRSD